MKATSLASVSKAPNPTVIIGKVRTAEFEGEREAKKLPKANAAASRVEAKLKPSQGRAWTRIKVLRTA
jgi:hypothetical protein